MSVIKFKQKGDFHKLNTYFERLKGMISMSKLDEYGKRGVEALKQATPVDTGATADGWYYTINRRRNGLELEFSNSNVQNGCNIAVILQYGHATRNGTWVEGTDYINPALRPIFDEIANELWKEVKR